MSDDKLTDEDKALFRHMMQAVKPLNKNKKLATKQPKQPEKPPPRVRYSDKPETTYDLSNHYTTIVNSESILTYCKQSIPRKRLSELKSGKIAWQSRLDLHGLKPDAARNSLCKFVEHQVNVGNRCLLIIHGKGGLHGEPPVLKNHVNHWLQQFPQVLAFHSALPRDGGSGALYVLLQRQREACY
jgi:DNA-nicking Smr family endonuclease